MPRAIRSAARRDPLPSASPGVSAAAPTASPVTARHRGGNARDARQGLTGSAVPAPRAATRSRRHRGGRSPDRCRQRRGAGARNHRSCSQAPPPTSPNVMSLGADAAQPRHLGAHAIGWLAAACNHHWPICPTALHHRPARDVAEFSVGAAHGWHVSALGRRCRCLGARLEQASALPCPGGPALPPQASRWSRPAAGGRRGAPPIRSSARSSISLIRRPPHQGCPASGSARPVTAWPLMVGGRGGAEVVWRSSQGSR